MKVLNERRRSARRKQIAPELADDAKDPNVHVYETIRLSDADIPPEPVKAETFYIDLESQVVGRLWRDYREKSSDSEDAESFEGSDEEND